MMSFPFLLGLLAGAALAESPWGPIAAPAGWTATKAEWTLTIREGEPVAVKGEYTLVTPEPRGEIVRLAGPELLVTDVSGPVYADPRGLQLVLDPEQRIVHQAFSGLYTPDNDGRLSIGRLSATRTHVTVNAPGFDVTLEGSVDGWLTPGGTLTATWRPHVEGAAVMESLVVQGEAASVFRADGGSLLVESNVRWRVVRGSARRLTFDANGLDEIEVSGPGVAKWRREGGQVIIDPKAPVTGLFAVVVRGRASLGKSERSVPTPEPTNVLRVDTYVTMARSDEGELIPVSMPTSVALGKLPVWAKNLGDGVPLVAWHGPQPVHVLPGGFETVQGPDTVVTQARFTLAAAREGHAALRMNLRVRNERRQYLHLRPAKGWAPVVVRVGNQPVSWLSDGQGGIYVPLEKSVETVKGLLSFPVDIEWLGTDQQVWDKRGEMALEVPSLDAPVQSATWEIHLPRGFRALHSPKEGTSRMIVTDVRNGEYADDSGVAEAERQRQEVVSSALQNAVSAYKKNDWSTAQQWLDEAKTVDEGNVDASSLQANLDIIEGRSSQNDIGSRRVKDLAKAKTSGLQVNQKSVEDEADYSFRAGDLDKAEAKYEEALAVANELQKTEQLESVEQSEKISLASGKLAEIRQQKQQRAAASGPSSSFGKKGGRGGGQAISDGVLAWGDSGGSVGGEVGGIEGGVVGGVLEGASGASVAFGADTPIDFSGLDIDGEASGSGGLGLIGTGEGGGGSAGSIGLGSIGTKGSGSGTGYGSGNGSGNGPASGATISDTEDLKSLGYIDDVEEFDARDAPAAKRTMAQGYLDADEEEEAYEEVTIERSSKSSKKMDEAPRKKMKIEADQMEAKPTPPARVTAAPRPAASARPAAPPPPPPAPMFAAPKMGAYKEAPAADEYAAYPVEAPPPEPMAEPMPVATDPETVTTGTVMTKDFLAKVPSGRSYQSVVGSAAGVTATAPPVFNPYAGQKGESYAPNGPMPGNVTAGRPVVPPTTAYAPPAKPEAHGYYERAAAAPADKDADDRESDRDLQLGLEDYHPYRPPNAEPDVRHYLGHVGREEASYYYVPAPPPDAFDPSGLPRGTPPMQVVDIPLALPDAFDAQGLALRVDLPPPDPKLTERPRRIPEKRKPLVASASPMALAMPLDGPTLTVTQALLPAGTFPTFRFLYKELPSENL